MTAESPYRVAVVGDGSAHPRTGATRPLATALAADADAIERLGGVRAVAVPVPAGGEALATRLRELPADVAAALITRTEPGRARATQHRLGAEAGRPVLTEEDTNAIALTASALAYLRSIGHRPSAARVLVAGASHMPVLTPILVGCGIHEVDMWNQSDERRLPLHRAVRDADVVLDPLRSPELARLAPDRPDGSILAAGVTHGPAVAAPGMLRALAEYPAGTVDVGIEQYCECARAIAVAVATRPRPWRPPRDPHISHAVAAALRRSADRQFQR
jgi:hypothetical protein